MGVGGGRDERGGDARMLCLNAGEGGGNRKHRVLYCRILRSICRPSSQSTPMSAYLLDFFYIYPSLVKLILANLIVQIILFHLRFG